MEHLGFDGTLHIADLLAFVSAGFAFFRSIMTQMQALERSVDRLSISLEALRARVEHIEETRRRP